MRHKWLKATRALNSQFCFLSKFQKCRNKFHYIVRVQNLQNSWPVSIKLLRRLRLGFSHSNGHIFWHNFKDTINTTMFLQNRALRNNAFFLSCQCYNVIRVNLTNNLNTDSFPPTEIRISYCVLWKINVNIYIVCTYKLIMPFFLQMSLYRTYKFKLFKI